MNTTDTDFYRVFAARVRTQLATTTREGDPAMTTQTAAESMKVPATFRLAPDAPCEHHAWCVETGDHIDHMGRRVEFAVDHGMQILAAHLYTDQPTGQPTLDFDPGCDDWTEFTSGDQLRAEVVRVRAHLARLDALADQYDAITEAEGEWLGGADDDGPEGVLRRAAAYVTEQGVTPGQIHALGIIARKVIEDGDPDGAGRRLAALLTAKLRGEGWKAAYGCPDWCVMDHQGDDGTPGFHQGPDATVPPLADRDIRSELPTLPEPLISARVTQNNQDSHIFGIETALWVWDGGDAYELDLAGARKMLADVERFVPQLRAAVALLAEAGKADIPADLEAKARWRAEQDARATAAGVQIARGAKQDGGVLR